MLYMMYLMLILPSSFLFFLSLVGYVPFTFNTSYLSYQHKISCLRKALFQNWSRSKQPVLLYCSLHIGPHSPHYSLSNSPFLV